MKTNPPIFLPLIKEIESQEENLRARKALEEFLYGEGLEKVRWSFKRNKTVITARRLEMTNWYIFYCNGQVTCPLYVFRYLQTATKFKCRLAINALGGSARARKFLNILDSEQKKEE